MEQIIYQQIIAKLKDAAVIAYIATTGQPALKNYLWFEDQVEQLLATDPETFPVGLPAVLIEFSEFKYENKNGMKREGNGSVTLHLVQLQTGKDGREDAVTHPDFKLMQSYYQVLIHIFDGFKLPCSARMVLTETKVDHKNRPLRDDQIIFSCNVIVKKPAGVP